MARPKKKGVDYFPHDCITGKTIFILEQKFGNDGYAFWFKLLEFLGTKETHFLDCNDAEDMEFLQAKTKLGEEFIFKILDLLSNLKAIDPELWQKKVVWSQRFVDGVAVVYTNRKIETPRRPDSYIVSTGHNPAPVVISEQPTSKSTQSRVEYSIVDNTVEEEGQKIEIQIVGTDLAVSTARLVWDDQKWREQLCMAHIMPETDLKQWMAQFNASVSNDPIPDFNAARYKKLFGGWLNKQKGKGYKLEKNNNHSPQLRKLAP